MRVKAGGGDTDTLPHTEGVRELELMIESGILLGDILEACRAGDEEACSEELWNYRFAFLGKRARADLITLRSDYGKDKKASRFLESVECMLIVYFSSEWL